MNKLALILLTIAALTIGAQAQDVGQRVVKEGIVDGNLYAAGEYVLVDAAVKGDVVAAGRSLTINRSVLGDVLGAGGVVEITGPVSSDVRVAGGRVMIDAPISGDLAAFGGTVHINSRTRVGGRTWASGGDISAAGRFEAPLRIAGRHVQLDVETLGDVEVYAETLNVTKDALIHGRLTYHAPQPAIIAPGAVINGGITYQAVKRSAFQFQTGLSWTSFVLFPLHVLIFGLLLFLLVPRLTREAARTVQSAPLRSVTTGFALLVTVPVAALVLMVSVLGIPLAFALVAVYLVFLLVGLVISAFAMGNLVARVRHAPAELGTREYLWYFAVGVVVLALLRALPGVGGVVTFLAVVFGLGAWSLQVYRTFSQAQATHAV